VRLFPCFTAGPTLTPYHSGCTRLVSNFLLGEIKGIPNLNQPIADIRDNAKAHYLALIRPEIHGKRIVIC
jgi:hypothetical protein